MSTDYEAQVQADEDAGNCGHFDRDRDVTLSGSMICDECSDNLALDNYYGDY